MPNPFLTDTVRADAYAAFYRFIEGEALHANIGLKPTPDGRPQLALTPTLTLDDDTLGILQWPNTDEERTLDQTDTNLVIGQARIAAFIAEGHPLFAVDTLFIDDKGDDALSQDAKRGRFILNHLLQAEADLEHAQLDEDGPYVWQITIELTIPSSEEGIDAFAEDEMPFAELVDNAMEAFPSAHGSQG